MYLFKAFVYYAKETTAFQGWIKWYKQNPPILKVYFKYFKIFHIKKQVLFTEDCIL